MITIKHVAVTGLRSLQNVDVSAIGNLTAFVGKNSSGKSNVLRALNLFFSNEVEPGRGLQFSRDLFEQPKRRQKKRIAIAVEFSLSSSFKLRKQQEYLSIFGHAFTITKFWELGPQRLIVARYDVVGVAGEPIPGANDLAAQFLSLIAFRYIPNRSVPVDILKTESQALAGAIFARMKDQTHATGLLKALEKAASRMLEGPTTALAGSGAPLSKPTVATTSLSEMLVMSGFRAQGGHGGTVQDEEWGAGHQGFFLYQILHTLDTDYSRFFGWRQATIWAVEEPESGLHRDLEARLAASFREWTRDPQYRLQILLTTHSPIFSMAADEGSWVELDGVSTKITPMPVSQLARAAEMQGVSGWTHPVLSHPWNPVILVEGQIDMEALNHVASLVGLRQLRFLSLPAVDSTEKAGGKDSMIGYLRKNQELIHHRQKEAPFLVLFDWETSDQEITKAKAAYGAGGADFVLRMDASHCEKLMGKDFKGIERFFPPSILVAAHNADELVMGIKDGKPFSISKDQLDGAKGRLLNRFLKETDAAQIAPLAKVLKDVQVAIDAGLMPQKSLFASALSISNE